MHKRFHWHTGLIFALSLSWASCGAPAIKYNYAAEPDPRGKEFVLEVSDQIHVMVRGQNDLSGKYTVPAHGTIDFPMIGTIPARGKTATAVRAAIVLKLKDYVKEGTAQVSVRLSSVNSYKFTVSGEVARGNLFKPKTYLTLTEAVAMAGGFSRFASRTRMYILRDTGGKGVKKIPINYDAIVSGKRPEMNIVILSGDVIHVP